MSGAIPILPLYAFMAWAGTLPTTANDDDDDNNNNNNNNVVSQWNQTL